MDVSGSPSVGELLERVKKQVVAGQQNQDIPFEQVVDLARPVRSASHSPLFQVMFAWQSVPASTAASPGSFLASEDRSEHVTSKFDLTLALADEGETITGAIEYASSLFDRSTVERYLGYWQTLLAAMAADERRPVDGLPLLGAAERLRMEEWNATERPYPRAACIHQLFEEQVPRTPDAPAIDRRTACAHATRNSTARQSSSALSPRPGMRPGDRVRCWRLDAVERCSSLTTRDR